MKIVIYIFFASFIIMTKAYESKVRNNRTDIDNIHKLQKIDVDSRIDIENSRRKNRRTKNMKEQLKDLESLVLAINTGVNGHIEPIKPSVANNIKNFVNDVVENENVKAFFRSNQRSYDIKPEIVHFKSDKPSIMVEVNFATILSALNDILKSKKTKEYAETFGHNAALIYRTLEESRKDGNSV